MFVAIPELLGETELAAEEIGFELLDLLVTVAVLRSNLRVCTLHIINYHRVKSDNYD